MKEKKETKDNGRCGICKNGRKVEENKNILRNGIGFGLGSDATVHARTVDVFGASKIRIMVGLGLYVYGFWV